MFTSKELQCVVSGTLADIDLKDLKAHTEYRGGYTSTGTHIKRFWEAISIFTLEEKSLLLKFVTSCPRPPLFGFKNLHPKFII
jgi:ubiquitin-protein ligase E3 C